MSLWRRPWVLKTPPIPRRRCARRLASGVEDLERRLLPAGNVAAIVSNSGLFLHGDQEANRVEVTVAAEGVIVRGLDGTAINGAATDGVAGIS